MPLLSLPIEVLFEIIGEISHRDSWLSVFRPAQHVLKLGQTCQLLRSLSIPYIYSIITIGDINVRSLHKLSRLSPEIFDHVRSLTLRPPHENRLGTQKLQDSHGAPRSLLLWQKFLDILRNCKQLQMLYLTRRPGYLGAPSDDFDDGFLKQLATEAKASIKSVGFVGVEIDMVMEKLVPLLCNDGFNALETLRIEGSRATHFDLTVYQASEGVPKTNGMWPSGSLESVTNFTFDWEAQANVANKVGYFARAMPNVKTLTMRTKSDYICTTLSEYAQLGSHLTAITLETKSLQGYELCEPISNLAPKLTRFVVTGGGVQICHKMFNPSEWTQIALLDIGPVCRCKSIRPDLLRENLEELTRIRPAATIKICVCGHTSSYLVLWDATVSPAEPIIRKHISPLEVFEELRCALVSPDDTYDDLWYEDGAGGVIDF